MKKNAKINTANDLNSMQELVDKLQKSATAEQQGSLNEVQRYIARLKFRLDCE